jgi:hypothetical protein
MSSFRKPSKAQNWAEADSSDDEYEIPPTTVKAVPVQPSAPVATVPAASVSLLVDDNSGSESEAEAEQEGESAKPDSAVDAAAAPAAKGGKKAKKAKKTPLTKEELAARKQKELKKLDAALADFGVKVNIGEEAPVDTSTASAEASATDEPTTSAASEEAKKKKAKKKPAKKSENPEPEKPVETGPVDIASILKARTAAAGKGKETKPEAVALALKAAEENKKSKKRVKANESQFAF